MTPIWLGPSARLMTDDWARATLEGAVKQIAKHDTTAITLNLNAPGLFCLLPGTKPLEPSENATRSEAVGGSLLDAPDATTHCVIYRAGSRSMRQPLRPRLASPLARAPGTLP